jgi:hypothetical protein
MTFRLRKSRPTTRPTIIKKGASWPTFAAGLLALGAAADVPLTSPAVAAPATGYRAAAAATAYGSSSAAPASDTRRSDPSLTWRAKQFDDDLPPAPPAKRQVVKPQYDAAGAAPSARSTSSSRKPVATPPSSAPANHSAPAHQRPAQTTVRAAERVNRPTQSTSSPAPRPSSPVVLTNNQTEPTAPRATTAPAFPRLVPQMPEPASIIAAAAEEPLTNQPRSRSKLDLLSEPLPSDAPPALMVQQRPMLTDRQPIGGGSGLPPLNCDEERAKLKPISALSTNIPLEPGDMPPECPPKTETFQPRDWNQLTYTWRASNLCHKPLYFEQVRLERYGHTLPPPLQPFASGAMFFATIPLLPYKMGLEQPNECIYTLGYYRPGSCAPYHIPGFPISGRGLLYESVLVGGLIAP